MDESAPKTSLDFPSNEYFETTPTARAYWPTFGLEWRMQDWPEQWLKIPSGRDCWYTSGYEWRLSGSPQPGSRSLVVR